eukprot:m.41322 g.41322  ORF g.41322 m.41322 type:complete len:61 (-) comp8198_c0_seq2:1553-1735(-)
MLNGLIDCTVATMQVNLIVLFLLVLYMYGKAIHTLDMVAKFAILLATANIVLSALLFAPV